MSANSETDGIHLWIVLWKAYASLRSHAERNIDALALGLSDFGVLEIILHKGPPPVNTIGAKIGLTSGSVSVAIDRLEHKGLVERKNDPGDRRARVVHLTEAGRKLIQKAFSEHAAAMEQAACGLSRRERALVIPLLKKLGLHAEARLNADS